MRRSTELITFPGGSDLPSSPSSSACAETLTKTKNRRSVRPPSQQSSFSGCIGRRTKSWGLLFLARRRKLIIQCLLMLSFVYTAVVLVGSMMKLQNLQEMTSSETISMQIPSPSSPKNVEACASLQRQAMAMGLAPAPVTDCSQLQIQIIKRDRVLKAKYPLDLLNSCSDTKGCGRSVKDAGTTLTFYSQNGQDERLWSDFFKGKGRSPGVFVELGAYTGVALSNTLFFEQHLGWRGVCIEPNPHLFKELKRNRPSCLNIQSLIDDNNAEKDYIFTEGATSSDASAWSGVRGLTKIEERRQTNSKIQVQAKKMAPQKLHEVLQSINMIFIDLLSLDVEGNELAILQSFDFKTVKVRVILVELNGKKEAISNLLKSRGYNLKWEIGEDAAFEASWWDQSEIEHFRETMSQLKDSANMPEYADILSHDKLTNFGTPEVVGHAPMALAHAFQLAHRAVTILVVAEGQGGELRVLLTKRHPNSKVCGGRWCLPGEHLLIGETQVEATRRGLMEEFGLQVPTDQIQKLDSWTYQDGIREIQLTTNVVVRLSSVAKIKVQKSELSEARFIKFSDFTASLTSESLAVSTHPFCTESSIKDAALRSLLRMCGMNMLKAFHCKSLSGLIAIADTGGSIHIPPLTSRVWIDIGSADNPILPPDDATFLLLIEALPQTAQHLRERFNEYTNVAVLNAAVSSSNGLAMFHPYKKTGHSSSLSTPNYDAPWAKGGTAMTIPTITLAEVFNNIPEDLTIDFLKTDMQGFDLAAIKSAGDNIQRVKTIKSEVYMDGKSTYKSVNNSWTEWQQYMQSHGYSSLKGCAQIYVDEFAHEMDCIFERL